MQIPKLPPRGFHPLDQILDGDLPKATQHLAEEPK